MDRIERQRRAGRLKVLAGAAAVAGFGVFSLLAAASTRQLQRRTSTPAEQISRLENQVGYSFFSSTKITPPVYASNPPQTSSGGS